MIHFYNTRTKRLIIRLFIFLAFVIAAGFLGLSWNLILIVGMAIFIVAMLGLTFGKKRKWKEPELREDNYNQPES